MNIWSLSLLLLLLGCSARNTHSKPDSIVSLQIIDRNGFAETISVKERLERYEKINFTDSQPYQKVLRVFNRSSEGSSLSKITTYHPNGQLWQFLEIVNGRAHGTYEEWHPNGLKRLSATVIEGTPDVSEIAQLSWLFDQKSLVWDENGVCIAEIYYEKGLLEKYSYFYHSNGKLAKEVPYHQDRIEGTIKLFDFEGRLIEELNYKNGLKEGICFSRYPDGALCYQELYEKDLLIEGSYFDQQHLPLAGVVQGYGKQAVFEKSQLSSLVEYKKGVVDGEIQLFDVKGHLTSSYHFKEGKKNGEEWNYYPTDNTSSKPKLFIEWRDDVMQGMVKTWYTNGTLESQRELNNNKKHGLSFAWYKEGELMLMEEYEEDSLLKGSYFKKAEKNPVSKVEQGKGTATLYDGDGRFMRKITYDKGVPQSD
jgi:antitoxin component YwqK of YwqJK toxin-antitoxin module